MPRNSLDTNTPLAYTILTGFFVLIPAHYIVSQNASEKIIPSFLKVQSGGVQHKSFRWNLVQVIPGLITQIKSLRDKIQTPAIWNGFVIRRITLWEIQCSDGVHAFQRNALCF